MLTLGVFGVDYKTSSFETREHLSFTIDEIPNALHRLHAASVVREIIILSTCNRMEVYCVTQDIEFVVNAICEIKSLCPRTVMKKCGYIYTGIDCVKHLFRVVSGLESMVLGETEIVAQVKSAYNLSKTHKTLSTHLSGLFQMALSVEKDVRNATEINNVAISMGSAIVNLIAVNVPDIDKQSILFIGAGQMMKQISPYFKNINCLNKTVINRSLENAKKLSNIMGASYAQLTDLTSLIDNYSIIIACCYSNSTLLDSSLLHNAITSGKSLLIIDLSMPLVTNLNLRIHDNIHILTIDDIAKLVDVGIEKRKFAAIHATNIINDKLIEYQNWERKRGLSPLIKALRDNAESVRTEIVSLAQKQLQNGSPVDSVIHELSIKLTNKLLHAPTSNLCSIQDNGQHELVNLVCYLYNLEPV